MLRECPKAFRISIEFQKCIALLTALPLITEKPRSRRSSLAHRGRYTTPFNRSSQMRFRSILQHLGFVVWLFGGFLCYHGLSCLREILISRENSQFLSQFLRNFLDPATCLPCCFLMRSTPCFGFWLDAPWVTLWLKSGTPRNITHLFSLQDIW